MNALRHVFQTQIRTSAEALWQALTEGEFTRRYFHETTVESTWELDAPFTMRLPNGEVAVRGEVLEAERPRRLVLAWSFAYSPDVSADPPSRVTYEIEPHGDTCKLTVIHDGFATETNTYRAVGGGWPNILASLKALLETGTPLPVAG